MGRPTALSFNGHCWCPFSCAARWILQARDSSRPSFFDRADLCLADLSHLFKASVAGLLVLPLLAVHSFPHIWSFVAYCSEHVPSVCWRSLLGIDDRMADVGAMGQQISDGCLSRGSCLVQSRLQIAGRSNRRGRRDCRSMAFTHRHQSELASATSTGVDVRWRGHNGSGVNCCFRAGVRVWQVFFGCYILDNLRKRGRKPVSARIDHSVGLRRRGCCLSSAERLADLTSSRSGWLVLAQLDCCLSGDFPDRTVALRLRLLQSW